MLEKNFPYSPNTIIQLVVDFTHNTQWNDLEMIYPILARQLCWYTIHYYYMWRFFLRTLGRFQRTLIATRFSEKGHQGSSSTLEPEIAKKKCVSYKKAKTMYHRATYICREKGCHKPVCVVNWSILKCNFEHIQSEWWYNFVCGRRCAAP